MASEIQVIKNHFLEYQNEELGFVSSKGYKSLKPLIKKYRGPTFVYDLDLISDRVLAMTRALPEVKLYFAMKANPHMEVLKLLKKMGLGADVVSLGEINQALKSGFLPKDIVYSGVGKTKQELNAAMDLDIYQINVESLPELERIIQIAREKNKKASVAFRLNPDISIETHPYIATGLRDNKFGIDLTAFTELIDLCVANRDYLKVNGISLHLGSQMLEYTPLRESLIKLKPYFLKLRQQFSECRCFDIGGGLGIHYDKQDKSSELILLQQYADIILSEMQDLKKYCPDLEVQSEPGRWLVAHAGALIAQVQYVKKTPFKNFVVLDSGMNHLLRPSLYEAYHEILLLNLAKNAGGSKQSFEFVGPICESADFLGKSREFSIAIKQDDFVVIADCGAYGASMSSDYNLQPRALELTI